MKTIPYLLSAGAMLFPMAGKARINDPDVQHDHPNIILILADDQGYGGIDCYPHNKRVVTPNIDGLAREGIQCTQAYTSGHVSSPSRAGIFTGQYQQNFGFYGLGEPHVGGIPEDTKMLAEYMKEMGYATGCVGKWHMGDYLRSHPLKRGYDYFFGFIAGQHDYFDPIKGHSWEGGSHGLAFMMDGFDPVAEMQYSTYEFTDRAIDFIEKNQQHPFFLHLAYNAIHDPLEAPEELIRQYADDPDHIRIDDIVRAMTVALDQGVGRVVGKLEELGLRENTLIFYLSDNGGATFSDNWNLTGSKGSYYEGGIRVPFIVNWPGVLPEHQQFDNPIIAIDIAPTVLAAAGYTGETEMDGVNLIPFLKKEVNGDPHEIIYWSVAFKDEKEIEKNEFAIRQGKWKLVSDPRIVKNCDLYDIEADPFELKGLKEIYPEKYRELWELYIEWIKTKPASLLKNGDSRMNGNVLIKKYNEKAKKLGKPQLQKQSLKLK